LNNIQNPGRAKQLNRWDSNIQDPFSLASMQELFSWASMQTLLFQAGIMSQGSLPGDKIMALLWFFHKLLMYKENSLMPCE
jgi:hypothetical protein